MGRGQAGGEVDLAVVLGSSVCQGMAPAQAHVAAAQDRGQGRGGRDVDRGVVVRDGDDVGQRDLVPLEHLKHHGRQLLVVHGLFRGLHIHEQGVEVELVGDEAKEDAEALPPP